MRMKHLCMYMCITHAEHFLHTKFSQLAKSCLVCTHIKEPLFGYIPPNFFVMDIDCHLPV